MTVERNRRRFATTHWSVVIAAAGPSPDADRALAELCETYWYPVYAFVRRSEYSSENAADLTQAFFARILEKGYVKDARPDRGRFRSFLLASLRHFLSNERDWRRAKKRDGAVPHVPLDVETGEHRYRLEPADPLTPERIYERRWTLTVLDNAMAVLARKYRQTGRGDLFLRLKPYLTGEDPPSYRELGEALSMSEGSLRIAVHRLRKEFASTLRAAIAETVERPEDVEDELRYLLGVVGRQN